MDHISIENREMTTEEFARMNAGFDELAVEEGVGKERADRFSFVASNENKFIGCASGLAYKTGSDYTGWFFLTDLFVEKEYRSKGLGSKLLIAIEEEVKSVGVGCIWLWTGGDKALRFYKRHHYQKFTEMEDFYADGSNRVGLRKNL